MRLISQGRNLRQTKYSRCMLIIENPKFKTIVFAIAGIMD